MMRRASILGLFGVLFSLFISNLPAKAQTLVSITVTAPSLPPSLINFGGFVGAFAIQNGSFAGLVATGIYSDGIARVLPNALTPNVTWSSNDASAIAVNSSGLATVTANFSIESVVGITAASGNITSSPIMLFVTPQTALYSTNGSNVGVGDITLGEISFPFPVPGLGYHTAVGGSNGTSPVPMVLGSETTTSFSQASTLTLLFVGNPGYQSNNTGDFVVAVINTATKAVIATITASDGLCYPTSMALKGTLLFVVNAGPAVFQATSGTSTAASCGPVTGQSAPNVDVFDVSGLFDSTVNNGTFKLVRVFNASDLAPGTAVPIVAATSIDPNDPFVYVGSTVNYNNLCNNSCAGTLTQITTSISPPSVTTQTALSFSSNSKGYSISPLGLTVATAYPSSAGQPTHTVFVVGPGFNTLNPPANNPPSTNGMYFWQFPDQCPNSPNATCGGTSPSLIFLEPGPSYVPIPTAVAPDGLTVYAGDGGFFLDSFVSSDGSFFSIANFFSTGGGTSCTAATCLPITSVATTADNQFVFAGFFGSSSGNPASIYRLNPSNLTLAGLSTSLTGPTLGLAITQSPEITANITSQVGTQVTANFVMHGNFQEQQNANSSSCGGTGSASNGPCPPSYGANITPPSGMSASLGGTINNTSSLTTQSKTVNSTSAGATQYTAQVFNTLTGINGLNSNGFIGTSPVGPVTVTFQSTAPSVAAGSASPFSVVTTNAIPDTVTLTPGLGSLSLSSTTPGTPGSKLPGVASGATVYYFAPAPINPNSVSDSITATADVAGCSSGTGNQCSAMHSLQVVAPTASLSTNSLTFSTPETVGSTTSQPITLSNSGPGNLVLDATTPLTFSGANASDFTSAADTTCTASDSIPSSGSCTIDITFKPAGPGTRTATLIITDNSGGATGATQAVTLTGTGQTPPTAQLSAGSLTFTSQTVGTTSAAQPVTLSNTGQVNLVLAAASPLAISGSNASEFAIAAGTTCTASDSIATSGNCTINITFTPAAAGTRTATLTITDNSGGTAGVTQTVSLTGTGQTPPTAHLSAGSLTFTSQTVGTTSAALPVTLSNTGQVNLVLAAANPLAISGPNASEFAIAAGTTCTASDSIATSGNCTINITFTPAAAGTRTATLTITDNSGGTAGATQTVSLTGTGQNPSLPGAALNTSSLVYPSQTIGTSSAPQQVMLSNTGQANLVLAANPLSVAGADASEFSVAAGTTCSANLSIAPNGSCVINVGFSPAASGTRMATLTITDNSGGTAGATQNVALSGTGVNPPQGSLSAATLTFNSQIITTTSPSQSVTLKNNGGANLLLSATPLSISGADAGDYAVATGTTCSSGASLLPAGTCVIVITFTPTATGLRTAILNIADNATNNPQTVTLNGTGAPVKVTISPSSPQPIPIVTSGSIQFTDTVQGSANQAVTWSVVGTGCSGSPCGTITSTGLYTAPPALPTIQPITDTVVATAQVDATRSASVTVSVSLASPVSVTVLPSTDTLNISTSAAPSRVQFSVKVQEVTNQSVTWNVNSIAGGNSTFGTITTTGLYTAPSTSPTPAAVTITAISAADPTKSGTATVTLVAPVTVTLTPASADVEVESGSSQLFTATVLPATASPNVTWSLSGTGCSGSGCGTLSNISATTATYMPNLNATASVVNITATSVADGSKSTSASINVFLKPVVSVSTPSATVAAGQPATYNFTLGPGTGDPGKPLTIQCDPRFLPAGVGCPVQIIQPGKSGVNFTLTLTTTGPLSAALISPISGSMIVASFGLVFPVGMLMFFKSRRDIPLGRRWGTFLVAIFLLSACLASMNGCATNGSFGQPSPKNFNVTPNGTFTIHVDGVGPSGVPEEIGQVTLIVN